MATPKAKKQLIKKESATQTNSYIVIHNSGGKTLQQSYDTYVKNQAEGGKGASVHYLVDDKQIVQLLKDDWGAKHTKGDGHYSKWEEVVKPGTCTNSNSIAIVVSDNASVDHDKAIDLTIDLIRYLVKKLNITTIKKRVLRNGDTQDVYSPKKIEDQNKWTYILNEIEKRNKDKTKYIVDFSELDKSDSTDTEDTENTENTNTTDTTINTGSGGGSANITYQIVFNDKTTVQESLPNANVSDNWVDMHKIKGITLHHYPPYHNTTVAAHTKYFESLKWDRAFHYKVDKDTEINFDKAPTSGTSTGGNVIGTSEPDVELRPGGGIYSGVIIGDNPVIGGINNGADGSTGGSVDIVTDVTGTRKTIVEKAAEIVKLCEDGKAWYSQAYRTVDDTKRITIKSGIGAGKYGYDCTSFVGCCYLAAGISAYKGLSASGGTLQQKLHQNGGTFWKYSDDPNCSKAVPGDIVMFAKSSIVGKADSSLHNVSSGHAAIYVGNKKIAHARSWTKGLAVTSMYGPNTAYFIRPGELGKDDSNNNNTKILKTLQLLQENEYDNVFGWPLPNIKTVKEGFGHIHHPITGIFSMHNGIDIPAKYGTTVYAYADGVVVNKGTDSVLGNYLKVKHKEGCYTVYAHLADWDSKEGEFAFEEDSYVTAGHPIGEVGDYGDIENCHLHFELIVDNERVDPLDYVSEGGGSRLFPPCFNTDATVPDAIRTFIESRDIATNEVTKDNIDKGKIVFASANNNVHTYIDRALFNNQSPKYTLSIGEFFDPQTNQIDTEVNYPETEKKMIEQCAKALYDEGFSADELWREFDLNRAPSPFLYLDNNKWIALLNEIQKQVDWLNEKYGKVTATYIPNALLSNNHKNEFIEMSPDLGVDQNPLGTGGSNPDSSSPGTTTLGSANDGIWIGDSISVQFKEFKQIDSSIGLAAEIGKAAKYFLDNFELIKKAKEDPKYISILLGINNSKDITSQEKLLEKIASTYPDIPKFVCKVLPVTKAYVAKGFNNNDEFMLSVEKFNSKMQEYCNNNNNFYYIASTTDGLIENDRLKGNMTPDGLHPNVEGSKTLYNNICKAISSTSITTNGPSNGQIVPNDGSVAPTIWNFLIEKGFSNECAAGVMGNVMRESSMNSNLTNKSSGAYGLFQWLGDRKSKLIAYANSKGKPTSDVMTQLEFMWSEISTKGHYEASLFVKKFGSLENFMKISNVDEATIGWEKTFERANETASGYAKRKKFAWEFYNKFAKKGSTKNKNIVKLLEFKGANKIAVNVNEHSCFIYKKANSYEEKLTKAFKGDEYLILEDTNEEVYKVQQTNIATADNEIIGYIRKANVEVIEKNKYGEALKDRINESCWVKFDNTSLITNTSKPDKREYALLNSRTRLKIIGIKDDFYQVELNDGEKGYVKAYRITFDFNYFTFEPDSTKNENLVASVQTVELINGDFEKSPTAEDLSNVPEDDKNDENNKEDENNSEQPGEDNNESDNSTLRKVTQLSNARDKVGGFGPEPEYPEDLLSEEVWETENKNTVFKVYNNPTWGNPRHFEYRGTKFGRITNSKNSKARAGIKQKITIENVTPEGEDVQKDFFVRISAWMKQVTIKDVDDGEEIDIAEDLRKNGITFYLIDGDDKVAVKTTLDIASKDIFARRTFLAQDLRVGDYTLVIGGEHQFDAFIDDITVEIVYDVDTNAGNQFTNGNIGIPGVGATSVDNGGIMSYSVAAPTNPGAKQPKIETVITQKEYEEIMFHASPSLIDMYVNKFEVYDKGLEAILNAEISDDNRLSTLTETHETFTGNMIRYNVVEAGPGSTDHCVKPADELDVLYKQVEVEVEPIYPDLIIPTQYATSNYDSVTKDAIPLQVLMNEGNIDNKDILNKQFGFDYEILNDKTKESVGKPINYLDAYPYDDKITELESHHPKVAIDEIESRLYSCNHPGCPIAHPMAKNFAMLNDMAIAQSKKTEQRLTKLENIMSTMLRNLGRLGSRMNINCVYFGGTNTFNKYCTIRCTHDDRLHDGCSVTVDQCMACTRFEPIIGQIYDILDENGINGSAILDDMQMSYMELQDFKNLNKIENRSSKFSYANAMKEEEIKPKSLIDIWKEKDKKTYEESLKNKYTDKKELEEAKKNIQVSDYVFIMDWSKTEFNTQSPDVKPFPIEGIVAKYYKPVDGPDNSEIDIEKDTNLNKDKYTSDYQQEYDAINRGEWIDTRDEADSIQENKYSSLDFYFKNFNRNRTGYEYDNGLAGYIGLEASSSGVTSSVNGTGTEVRNKICEKAREIVQLHKDSKAAYSNNYRTIDDTNRIVIKEGDTTAHKDSPGMFGYDCSSFASCCYKHAGLTSLYNKRCASGEIMKEITQNGGLMWLADEKGLTQAKPGDCIVVCGKDHKNPYSPTEKDISENKALTIYHILVYLGTNSEGKHEVAHSSTYTKPVPNGIRIDIYGPEHYSWGKTVFIRPKDLREADEATTSPTGSDGGAGVNCVDETGTIDGHNYVYKFNKAFCTGYGDPPKKSASGITMVPGKHCAAHNMPYGTKLYIPALKGKYGCSDGIITVADTGGHGFDFDLYLATSEQAMSRLGYSNMHTEVYVLEWGKGKVAASFTYIIEYYNKNLKRNDGKPGAYRFHRLFKEQMKHGGCTINFYKFQNDDANIRQQPWWNQLRD